MERRYFLTNLGVLAFAVCAGCSKSGGVSNTGGSTGGGSTDVNFSVDLSDLVNVGDSIVQQGVIVVRLAETNTASSFTAVQVNCTHEGASIAYHESQQLFICPLHGSEFNNSGVVVLGPATSNLKKYMVTINGNDLVITS